MAKYGHVREGGKVGRSNATPTNFFSVDSYDLKSVSFKFGNDIFITFEMPGSSYSRPVDKIHISLQFRPSVVRGPWIIILMYTLYLLVIGFLITYNYIKVNINECYPMKIDYVASIIQ